MERIIELLGKTPVMVILMGIPASGKSTFCIRYLSELLRINLDTIGTRHKESMMLFEVVGEGKKM